MGIINSYLSAIGNFSIFYFLPFFVMINCLIQKGFGLGILLLVGQDLFHVFVLFDCPETKLAIKQIGDFFDSHVK